MTTSSPAATVNRDTSNFICARDRLDADDADDAARRAAPCSACRSASSGRRATSSRPKRERLGERPARCAAPRGIAARYAQHGRGERAGSAPPATPPAACRRMAASAAWRRRRLRHQRRPRSGTVSASWPRMPGSTRDRRASAAGSSGRRRRRPGASGAWMRSAVLDEDRLAAGVEDADVAARSACPAAAAHRAMVSIGRSAPRSSSHQGSCSALVNWTRALERIGAGRQVGSRPPSMARGACPPVAPPATRARLRRGALHRDVLAAAEDLRPRSTLSTVARPGRTSRT